MRPNALYVFLNIKHLAAIVVHAGMYDLCMRVDGRVDPLKRVGEKEIVIVQKQNPFSACPTNACCFLEAMPAAQRTK